MSPDGVFAYVVNSIAWSFVGAASVVIWCRLRNGDRPVMRVRKPNWLVIIAIAILVFAIASTLVSYGVDSRQRRFVACQAEVNQSRTAALNELNRLASEDRQALDDLVEHFLEATQPGQGRQILEDYRATRQRTDAERKKHPLPQPNDLCGRPPAK